VIISKFQKLENVVHRQFVVASGDSVFHSTSDGGLNIDNNNNDIDNVEFINVDFVVAKIDRDVPSGVVSHQVF
jgi:hypothetical protein